MLEKLVCEQLLLVGVNKTTITEENIMLNMMLWIFFGYSFEEYWKIIPKIHAIFVYITQFETLSLKNM